MDAHLYYPIFIYSVAAFCLGSAIVHILMTDDTPQLVADTDHVLSFLVCLFYALFIGFRPFNSLFGDTIAYTRIYDNFHYLIVNTDWDSEWVWEYIMLICKRIGLSASGFFTVVSLGYFFTAYFAICLLTPKDVMLTLLFVLSSLMFYAFGINGLRNGLACHFVLLGIALLLKGYTIPALIVYLFAFGTHRSTILPIVASLVGAVGPRNLRPVIYLWIASIPVSFFAGNFFSLLFARIGFDYRMITYTSPQDMALFRHIGFRWDFLLYSSLPVVMAWWITAVKRISDRWYTVMVTVYILSNIFWLLVIRSAYSNRFAYLSWFIYPLVISYPLTSMPLWRNGRQKAALGLILYVVLTIVLSRMMNIL